jgi:hypothetical protein
MIAPKTVTIQHGSDVYTYPLVGYTIGDAIQSLDDHKFGGALEGLSFLLSRDGVNDPDATRGTTLGEGDTLKFMNPAGDKG